jgi:hypothetical protein
MEESGTAKFQRLQRVLCEGGVRGVLTSRASGKEPEWTTVEWPATVALVTAAQRHRLTFPQTLWRHLHGDVIIRELGPAPLPARFPSLALARNASLELQAESFILAPAALLNMSHFLLLQRARKFME